MTNSPLVEIKHASLAYNGNAVFADISLTLIPGKWIALLGASGVGKSSLLRMLAGLTLPEETTSGSIRADNDIPVKNQLAYMAQTDLLLPWLSVIDNVQLGYRLRQHTRAEKQAAAQAASVLLAKAGLSDAHHLFPQQLSGGMRQRVALVRTLLENKPIILMDEPFSALDTITRYQLHELAVRMLRGKTVLFITHDPAEALRLADEIYIMRGQPAKLKSVANLTSSTPRAHHDAEVLSLQSLLFQELTHAAGEAR